MDPSDLNIATHEGRPVDFTEQRPDSCNGNGPPLRATPLMVELCAGNALLSRAFHKIGWQVRPVDWHRQGAAQHLPFIKANLHTNLGQSIVQELVRLPNIRFVLLSPPQFQPILAEFLLRCALNLLELSVPFAVENPASSELWAHPSLRILRESHKTVDFLVFPCAFDGPRHACSRWLTNILELQVVSRACKGCDKRLPGNPQAAELRDSVFSPKFRLAVVDAVNQYVLLSRGETLPRATSLQNAPSDLQPLVGRLKQARKRATPQPVSEFKEVAVLPKHVMNEFSKPLIYSDGGVNSFGDNSEILCGIYRNPIEFEEEASKLEFPLDSDSLVHDELLMAVRDVLVWGPARLIKFRADSLRDLLKTRDEVQARNIELQQLMDESSRVILKGKNLALLEKILIDNGYPDAKVIEEAARGFDLTGFPKPSGIFHPIPSSATMDDKQLLATRVWNNKALAGKVSSSMSAEDDAEIWRQAMDEVARGWLAGPWYDEKGLLEHMGGEVLCSRRFPLRQGEKVRAIDDLSESQVNSAFAMTEKVSLMGLDSSAALTRKLYAVLCTGSCDFRLSSGGSCVGRVDDGWYSGHLCPELLGRVLDLKSAYKQWTLSPSARRFSGLILLDPVKRAPAFFSEITLPFGAAASVLAFNRLARAVWFAVVRTLRGIWSTYFDDFMMLDFNVTANSFLVSVEALLSLLGWEFAEDAKKCLPFASSFNLLGARVNLQGFCSGEVFFENIPERRDKIVAQIRSFWTEAVHPGRNCRH